MDVALYDNTIIYCPSSPTLHLFSKSENISNFSQSLLLTSSKCFTRNQVALERLLNGATMKYLQLFQFRGIAII